MKERWLAFMMRLTAWRYFPPLCLSVMWGTMVFLAYPVGEFPVNDTWAFSQPVKKLLETGGLELSHWPFMSLIAHILWGYLVSLLFGFSYTVLRCSVACLGLVGLWGLYALLMEVTRDRRVSFLGTTALAVNPLYFHLACTFMTDVPFLALNILSFLFLFRGVSRESRLWIVAGALGACAATLIRQVGVLIPLSFGVAYLYKHRFQRPAILTGLLVALAVFGTLAVYECWLDMTDQTPLFYRTSERDVLAKCFGELAGWLTVIESAVACLIYLGLFLLPILVWFFSKEWRFSARPVRLALQAALLLGWTLGVTVFLMQQDRLMPLRMNGSLFYDFGLGPPSLRDVFRLHRPHLPRAPEGVMILLTALGALGGGLLLKWLWRAGRAAVSSWIEKRQDVPQAWVGVMALSAFVLYITPIAVLHPFDRYLLFCVPVLLMSLCSLPQAVAARPGGVARCASAVCLIVFAVFGVGGTHDYFAWNRARWQAARDLMDRFQITPEKIDGGFEFNGLYCYDPFYSNDGTKSWWWVQDDQYIISFGPLRDYTEFARYHYRRWMPPGYGWIYVLQRNEGDEKEIVIASTRRHGGENQVLSYGDMVRYWHGDGRSAPVALSYGDYVNLEPGRYVATLYYMARRPQRERGHGWGQIRLVKFDNGPTIVEAEIDPVETSFHAYRRQDIRFSLEEGYPVEAQIIGGDVQLWLYRIVFTKAAD